MHPYVGLLGRGILGTIWTVAGLAKLIQGSVTLDAVERFDLLPLPLAKAFGRVLPIVELLLGFLLLGGLWIRVSATISLILLACFTLVIAFNLIRGHRFHCNCFGQLAAQETSWFTVIRNLGLVCIALYVMVGNSAYLALDGLDRHAARATTNPPASGFIPILLLTLLGAMTWFVCATVWNAVTIIAHSENGPAVNSVDYTYLRRWLRLSAAASPEDKV